LSSRQIKTIFIRLSSIFLVLVLIAMAVIANRMLKRLPTEMIYLIETKDAHFGLKAVARKSDTSNQEDKLRDVINALIKGPSFSEQQRGLSSSLPKSSKLLSLSISGAEVTVDFSKEILEPQGISASIGMLNQIYYSLCLPKNIDSVRLLVEGSPLNYLGGEGIVVEQPWRKQSAILPTW